MRNKEKIPVKIENEVLESIPKELTCADNRGRGVMESNR